MFFRILLRLLKVGSLTTHAITQCLSTLLATFASSFHFLPSPINWNYVFANADFNKNKTIYSTVICISILYCLLIIYARHKDKQDIEKLGVTALPDNYREDQYCYQIIVFTGYRKDAGTKSNVQFIVAGDLDQTKVRTFSDSKRKIFERGGIDAFIMTVPK
jgi:polycystin 1L2